MARRFSVLGPNSSRFLLSSDSCAHETHLTTSRLSLVSISQVIPSQGAELAIKSLHSLPLASTLSRVSSGSQTTTSFASSALMTPGTSIRHRGIFSFPQGRGEGKKYNERRLLGYSPDQLYKVITEVDQYHLFVPWCRSSRILTHKGAGYFEAELEVGFQLFNERYTSKVTMEPPGRIICRVDNSQLFFYLDNLWELRPGPTPQSCWVSLQVDFEFKNPLYRQVATLFLDEVVKRMIVAFEGRCRVLFGSPYGRGAGQIGAKKAGGRASGGGLPSQPKPAIDGASATTLRELTREAPGLEGDRGTIGTSNGRGEESDDQTVRRPGGS